MSVRACRRLRRGAATVVLTFVDGISIRLKESYLDEFYLLKIRFEEFLKKNVNVL